MGNKRNQLEWNTGHDLDALEIFLEWERTSETPATQLWPCCLGGKDDCCFQILPDDVVGLWAV